jgi:predicted component of type VI protein secretion system
LFEPTDYDTEVSINRDIAEAIQKFEPRVQLISIESIANEENNSIDVTIEYFVVGVPQQQTLQTSITTRVK